MRRLGGRRFSGRRFSAQYAGVFLALLAFIALWQALSVAVTRPILPSPAATARALVDMAESGALWENAWISLSRVALALLAAGVPAVALGLAAGRSARVNRVISPVVYLLHPLPKAAFLPIIMLFLGIGEAAKVFLVAFVVFSQMLVGARDAARQIGAQYIDAARAMGAGRLAVLRHVVIPAALPGLFTAFRISLGTAMAVLFIAETFVSTSGLGHLIYEAWTRIAYARMYAGIAALGILGLALFVLVDLLEALFCPWRSGHGD
ncbi:MAG: ABC transporter permease [Treponema sp.]|nr:ABC transporter permease [Treponema sp.]